MPIRLGVHENYTPQETKVRWAGVQLTREFIGGELTPQDVRPKFDSVARPVWNAGLTPMVSFKTKPADVAAGTWDTHVKDLATWLLAQPESLVALWHEPEDDMTGDEFSTMFKRVRNAMKSRNPLLRIGYIAMAYQWKPKAGDETLSLTGRTDRPQDWRVQADFYGCDVYSGNTEPLTAILPEHTGFMRWLKYAVPSGSLYMVTERGFEATSTTAQTRSDTVRREGAWLASSDPVARRCEAYLYWNTPGTEQDTKLLLDLAGEAAVLDAFHQVMKADQTYDQGVKDGRNQTLDGMNAWIAANR